MVQDGKMPCSRIAYSTNQADKEKKKGKESLVK
jgi:hypothetical protein